MGIRAIGRNLVVVAAAAALVGGCGSKDGGATGATSTPGGGASTGPSTAAGNGVAALEATAIVDRAKAALKSAKSFRVKGAVNDGGQQTKLDFEVRGADVAGSMSVGKSNIKVLKVGGKQYMKPDAAFWKTASGKQADKVIRVVGDKWVLVPASNKDFGSLFTVADVDQLLQASGSVEKGPAKEIDGKPAIGLVDKGSDGGTLYVATSGEPYPLRVDGPTAADGGLAFSDFGATFADIKAPAASHVLDLGKIGG